MPEEKRVPFLKKAVERYMGTILLGMTHDDKVELMNSLFPLFVKEFPLAELDVVSAFSSSSYAPREEFSIDAT